MAPDGIFRRQRMSLKRTKTRPRSNRQKQPPASRKDCRQRMHRIPAKWWFFIHLRFVCEQMVDDCIKQPRTIRRYAFDGLSKGRLPSMKHYDLRISTPSTSGSAQAVFILPPVIDL